MTRYAMWVDFSSPHEQEKLELLITKTLERNGSRVNYMTTKVKRPSPGRPSVTRPKIREWIQKFGEPGAEIVIEEVSASTELKPDAIRRALRQMEKDTEVKREFIPGEGVRYYVLSSR